MEVGKVGRKKDWKEEGIKGGRVGRKKGWKEEGLEE